MGEPIMRRDGSSYVWEFPDVAAPCRMILSRIREDGDGLKAEILVESFMKVGPRPAVYHWAMVNLSSTATRTGLSKLLSGRDGTNNWAIMLEQVCYGTAMRFRTPPDLVALDGGAALPSVRWLVSEYLAEGAVTLLTADGDSGKSWLALAWALAVATGRQVGPCVAEMTGPVLYLDYETDYAECQRRLGRLERAHGLRTGDVHYRRMDAPLLDALDVVLADVDHVKPVLVIVDSLMPATRVERENLHTAASHTMHALRDLGPTILGLAHVTKEQAQQTRGRARTFGSVFYENLARSVWEMRRDENGTENEVLAGLYHRKMNLGPRFPDRALRLVFDDEAGTTHLRYARLDQGTTLTGYASLGVRIEAVLHDGPATAQDIAEACDAKPETVTRVLKRLVDGRKVVRLDDNLTGGRGRHGRWALHADEPF